jgi:hypothetical protein
MHVSPEKEAKARAQIEACCGLIESWLGSIVNNAIQDKPHTHDEMVLNRHAVIDGLIKMVKED